MVNLEKRQFLKALGLILLGYLVRSVLPASTGGSTTVKVKGDGTAKVRVENGALVVE